MLAKNFVHMIGSENCMMLIYSIFLIFATLTIMKFNCIHVHPDLTDIEILQA